MPERRFPPPCRARVLRLAESAGRHLSLQVEPAIIEPTRTSDLMNQLIRIQIEPNADLRAAPQSLGFGGT
jgi:hypothetical protein